MPSANSPTIRVLIVDDDPSTLRFMQIFLKSAGFDVLTAPGRKTAIESVAANTPDIIVTDFRLEDGSGAGLIGEARQQSGKHIPAILLTGFSGDNLAADERDLFAACITKPIDNLDNLANLIYSVAL